MHEGPGLVFGQKGGWVLDDFLQGDAAAGSRYEGDDRCKVRVGDPETRPWSVLWADMAGRMRLLEGQLCCKAPSLCGVSSLFLSNNGLCRFNPKW